MINMCAVYYYYWIHLRHREYGNILKPKSISGSIGIKFWKLFKESIWNISFDHRKIKLFLFVEENYIYTNNGLSVKVFELTYINQWNLEDDTTWSQWSPITERNYIPFHRSIMSHWSTWQSLDSRVFSLDLQ